MRKAIATTLSALVLATSSYAAPKANPLQEIEDYVKAHTERVATIGGTVGMCGIANGDKIYRSTIGGIEVEVSSKFIAFKNRGEKSMFIYDMGKDGHSDTFVMVPGKINPMDESYINIDAFGCDQSMIEKTLELSSAVSSLRKNKKPIDRRSVIKRQTANTARIYDFESGDYGNSPIKPKDLDDIQNKVVEQILAQIRK